MSVKPFEKPYKLHQLLQSSRYPVSLRRIEEELKCSTSTARRVIREMRRRLNAPIECCGDPPGYRYSDVAFKLPRRPPSEAELPALFLLRQLVQSFEPGALADLLPPVLVQVDEILGSLDLDVRNAHRIRVLRVASRPVGPFFGDVSKACLQRLRMSIKYCSPTGRTTQRVISPQRLSQYRDKWYLDAWCHLQDGLRTFTVDRIKAASVLEVAAVDIDDKKLDLELGSSFGIIAGEPTATAKLLFTPERAPWIDGELWHPAQKGQRLKSGEYLLEIPYSRPEELILEILRYGPDVEVLEPMALREAVAEQLRAAAAQYPMPVKKAQAKKAAARRVGRRGRG